MNKNKIFIPDDNIKAKAGSPNLDKVSALTTSHN